MRDILPMQQLQISFPLSSPMTNPKQLAYMQELRQSNEGVFQMTTSHRPGPILFCRYSALASMDSELLQASSIRLRMRALRDSVMLEPQYYFWSEGRGQVGVLAIRGLEQSLGLKMKQEQAGSPSFTKLIHLSWLQCLPFIMVVDFSNRWMFQDLPQRASIFMPTIWEKQDRSVGAHLAAVSLMLSLIPFTIYSVMLLPFSSTFPIVWKQWAQLSTSITTRVILVDLPNIFIIITLEYYWNAVKISFLFMFW